MRHAAIDQVTQRAENAKSDSDFTYFFTLLLLGEALAKAAVLGLVAAIGDDKDRNRYRLEHQLVHADGVGDWGRVVEDALTGQAAQFLIAEARNEQAELTRLTRKGDWQYDSVAALRATLELLDIDAEALPVKTDMRRWFRLFATLRNKTRAHGATQPARASVAANDLAKSIQLFYDNCSLFSRPWAYLHRNLSGKYRVSRITQDGGAFDFLAKQSDHSFPNGVHIFLGKPRHIPLFQTDPELQDFFLPNGGLTSKRYELLSYYSDNRRDGDLSSYITPPGTLPPSETEGHGELIAQDQCLSNVPDLSTEYIPRPRLEEELNRLLVDDRRPIITLVGSGGIGKTSLALSVVRRLFGSNRYEAIIWFSARDVDLQLSGPKQVRPSVISPDDISKLYARLVCSEAVLESRDFNPRTFFEQQLQRCDLGSTLFIFDNFETTQSPIETFNWIESFIRLPNKALITTRLREFKGDYPVEVQGMEEPEALALINQTAARLGITKLIDKEYVEKLIAESSGHPYVIKILLGEVEKRRRAANIPQIVAGSEDILIALFERTYASLSPCAQRAFLTLSAWNSHVPRLALEAVLLRSTQERDEVEKGIESLLQFSLAEQRDAPTDKQPFMSLPLVASVFGRKKLNVSPFKAGIQSDVELLQMLGPSRPGDIHLGLALRLERFIANIARRVEAGESFEEFEPILEMICRNYNPGWLILARWHMETRSSEGYESAKRELRLFLENDPDATEAPEAWLMLGHACYQTGELLGEIHAFVERAQLSSVPFNDLSSTANRLNQLLRERPEIGREARRSLAQRLMGALDRRRSQADADDFSRMAWVAIHAGQESKALTYAEAGLKLDPYNIHCRKVAERLRRES